MFFTASLLMCSKNQAHYSNPNLPIRNENEIKFKSNSNVIWFILFIQ